MTKKQYLSPTLRYADLDPCEALLLAGAKSGRIYQQFEGSRGYFTIDDAVDLRDVNDVEIEIQSRHHWSDDEW